MLQLIYVRKTRILYHVSLVSIVLINTLEQCSNVVTTFTCNDHVLMLLKHLEPYLLVSYSFYIFIYKITLCHMESTLYDTRWPQGQLLHGISHCSL